MERKDSSSPWFTRLYEILSRDGSILTLFLIGLFFTPGIMFFAYFIPEHFWEVDIWKLLVISATYTWLFLAFSLSVNLIVIIWVSRRIYANMRRQAHRARLLLNSVDINRDTSVGVIQKLEGARRLLDDAEVSKERLFQIEKDIMPRGKDVMGELIMVFVYTASIILVYKYILKTNDLNRLLADGLTLLLPGILFGAVYVNRYRSAKMLVCAFVVCVLVGLLLACVCWPV